MLSIFCPYRNRKHFYDDFINHYLSKFPTAKIYMLEQFDDNLFMRGQLMNSIFIYLLKENIDVSNMLFVDLDIRMVNDIDFEGLLNQYKTVVIPYNELLLYTYEVDGTYVPENKKSYFLDEPDGGVTLFTKEMFIKCNGFSNLYIGWGREDSDFVRRNVITRVPNKMIHLAHTRNQEWLSDAFKRNDANFSNQTDFLYDGYTQTVAKFRIKEIASNVYHCKIRDISVSKDYKYKDRIAQC